MHYICLIVFILSFGSSCRPSSTGESELLLEAGSPDFNGKRFPGIYGLAVKSLSNQSASDELTPHCTATAISSTVLVTAAHCLKKSDSAQIYYILDYDLSPLRDEEGGRLIGEGVAHPMSQFSSSVSWRQPYDLAFIRVKQAIFKSTYSLLDRVPEPREGVEVVGYGVSKARQIRGRQFGKNKIQATLKPGSLDPLGRLVRSFYHSLILVAFDRQLNSDPINPQNSGTVPGDSGGPLLLQGRIAGILYGGAYWNQERDELEGPDRGRFDDSVYVNPQTEANRGFIQSLIDLGWDIPR